MKQLSLPGMSVDKVVNVASVPQRSPFRYPGGKTWLIPRIRQWLSDRPEAAVEFIEPFAGGAIVGLSVAFEHLANHVTLAELDEQVAAVWQTIIEDGDGAWLAEQISAFELTSENVDALLALPAPTVRERALQTIVKNRVNRGGILANGAGKIKHGEAGRGLASRWYPETLQKRILSIHQIRDRLTFIHGDGMQVIRDNSDRQEVVFFIDPPYTASGKKPGKRLYDHSDVDHSALFEQASAITGDFLMTYENTPEIVALAVQHRFEVQPVAMKNTHHAKQTELLIGRDLTWLR